MKKEKKLIEVWEEPPSKEESIESEE